MIQSERIWIDMAALYNAYGDAVITAVRPIGGNTDGYKAYVIKEVPTFEETE